MKRSFKYVGLMGLFNMVNEVLIIKQRDYFLQRNYRISVSVGQKAIHENKENADAAENSQEESKGELVKFKASNFKDIKKIFEERKRAEEEARKNQQEKK